MVDPDRLSTPYRSTAAGLHGKYSRVHGCNAAKGSRQTSRVTLEDAMAPTAALMGLQTVVGTWHTLPGDWLLRVCGIGCPSGCLRYGLAVGWFTKNCLRCLFCSPTTQVSLVPACWFFLGSWSKLSSPSASNSQHGTGAA